jgi:hypothetical protein
MSGAFAHQLRARGEPIRLGSGGEALRLRVQMAEQWDAVRVEAPPGEPVRAVKINALDRLQPGARAHDEYVVKFRGWEVHDETATLGDIGAKDGATLLIHHRKRRPVR